MISAKLILKTGEVFYGQAPEWQQNVQFGEVVFNTGMVGYVECLTDPSYRGQLLAFTYPLIGNYGVPNCEHWESDRIHAAGLIVSELADFHARPTAEKSLLEWCKEHKTAIITGIDTRALTKCLRDKGVVAGAIVTGNTPAPKDFPDINAAHLVQEVSIKQPSEWQSCTSRSGSCQPSPPDSASLMLLAQSGGPPPVATPRFIPKVIAIDCGMKQNIWRNLSKLPIQLKRVPFDYDFTQEDYDGVFVSNGPGDPIRCEETIAILRKVLTQKKPVFGICLGAQLMGLAIGAKTYKLRFGHRSQNQPCLKEGSERCWLTSQNHGYAVDETTLPSDWQVTYRNLNDNTVQGIMHKTLPYFSVQFHPEAAPGPIDTTFLFEEFYDQLRRHHH